jgi:hypothetical protein
MDQPVFEVCYGAQGATLEAYIASRSPVTMIMGPLGSGKTHASIQKCQIIQQEQAPNHDGCRRTRGYAVRNTYPELMATTVKDFEEMVDDRFYKLRRGGLEPPTATLQYDLPDGTWVWSELVFLALDRADAVRRLRGSQPTYFWMNEVKELAWEVVIMANGRHGRFPPMMDGGATWHGMFGDYNAPDEDHWIAQMADNPPDGWEFLRQPGGVLKTGIRPDGTTRWEPNPEAENLANLPEGYYENQISVGRSRAGDAWINVNLANNFGIVIDGKPVHPMYNDAQHCDPDGISYESGLPIYLGVDYGRTPAAVIAQEDERLGRWLIIGEYVAHDMSAALFGPQLRDYLERRYPGAEIRGWGDPAGDARGQATEDTPRDIMRASGIPIDAAPSNVFALRTGALDKVLGSNAMDGRPRLIISGPDCPKLRRALMGGYRFRRLKLANEERYTDQPEKDHHSHVAEALHYLLLGVGLGKEILRKKRPHGRRMPRRAILR